jgi:XXXCH domain-containing protein
MKSKRFLGVAALAGALFAVTNLAVGQDGDKLTNKQIMIKLNNPMKGVFSKLKKDLAQPTPDWPAISKESKEILTLTEALAMNAPRKGDKGNWSKQTDAYTKSAKTLAEACEKMDLTSAKAAQQALGAACSRCHQAHK